MENILSSEFVRKRADMLDVGKEMGSEDSINILSVGRFAPAKNYDNVPDICSRIIKKGIQVDFVEEKSK